MIEVLRFLNTHNSYLFMQSSKSPVNSRTFVFFAMGRKGGGGGGGRGRERERERESCADLAGVSVQG